jgi:hypothetical protein
MSDKPAMSRNGKVFRFGYEITDVSFPPTLKATCTRWIYEERWSTKDIKIAYLPHWFQSSSLPSSTILSTQI